MLCPIMLINFSVFIIRYELGELTRNRLPVFLELKSGCLYQLPTCLWFILLVSSAPTCSCE